MYSLWFAAGGKRGTILSQPVSDAIKKKGTVHPRRLDLNPYPVLAFPKEFRASSAACDCAPPLRSGLNISIPSRKDYWHYHETSFVDGHLLCAGVLNPPAERRADNQNSDSNIS